MKLPIIKSKSKGVFGLSAENFDILNNETKNQKENFNSNLKLISELESNSKSNTMRFDGTYVLTKIPQKTEENTQNRRLNIAFNKATDAARMVRRLEYSYGMRINILLSKPIYQKNA